jgi:hypothetical protein
MPAGANRASFTTTQRRAAAKRKAFTGSLLQEKPYWEVSMNKHRINRWLAALLLSAIAFSTVAAAPLPAPACMDKAKFVKDVTYPDNTQVLGGETFVKIWRLKNVGTCTWTKEYDLVYYKGYKMGSTSPKAMPQSVAPGETIDLKVSFTAPVSAGTYRSEWRLQNAAGKAFGIGSSATGSFWAQIVVGKKTVGGVAEWKGEYFKNAKLRGAPSLIRTDSRVSFDWRRGAPYAGIPKDMFSVRWTTRIGFERGTYRFTLTADDGARLYVDDHLVLDGWNGHSKGEELVTDVSLASAKHSLRVEYRDLTGAASVHLTWRKLSSPTFPDWEGRYFSNRRLQGTPALIRNDSAIDFQWKLGAPAVGLPEDGFSIRWTRQLTFEPATYRFSVTTIGGVRVYVDGAKALDAWDAKAAATRTFDLTLDGAHKIAVEYVNREGKATVKFSWAALEPVPSSETTLEPVLEDTTQ